MSLGAIKTIPNSKMIDSGLSEYFVEPQHLIHDVKSGLLALAKVGFNYWVNFLLQLEWYHIVFFSLCGILWIKFMHIMIKEILPPWLESKNCCKSRCQACAESIYCCVYSLILFLSCIALSWSQPWFWDTRYYWIPTWLDCTIPCKVIYTIEFYHYMSSFLLMFYSTRRKYADRWLMGMHHIVAMGLISNSYIFRQWRIGMVVFMIHDIADIFLEGAKSFKYFGKSKLKEFSFCIFVLTWFIPRGLIYPMRIIKPTFDAYYIVQDEPSLEPLYYFFLTMLILLLCINLIWSLWIIRIIVHMFGSSGATDLRSKEVYDQDNEDKNK